MKTVLIVEDQPDIRKLIRLALEREGLAVLEAANGDEGYAQACAAQPDVMLLDVMMPGGPDGFQVCRKVKSTPQLGRVWVVILTARDDDADRAAALAAGADGYMLKPFSPLTLAAVVERRLAAC